MRKLIVSIPAKTVTDAFTTAINTAIVPLAPFKINLTEEEKGARSMAEGREGYARLVSRIANQFPNSLGRADVPTDLAAMLAYYDSLEGNKFALLQAVETIQETQLAAAIDIMTYVDRYADNLQISRRNEGSVDLAMREVDDWNKRFASNKNADNGTSASV